MYIYKITNLVNEKIYIGLTSKTIEFRFNQHKRATIKYALHKAFEKHGIENFKIDLLDCCETREEASSLEQFYISKYNSNNDKFGYNLTAGGEYTNGELHCRATLKDSDIIRIRMYRKEGHKCKNIYKFYEDKIKFSSFEKIWLGATWTHIGMDLIQGIPINKAHKKHLGQDNGNALLTDDEVLTIRKFYVNNSLDVTYATYGDKHKTKDSFRSVIANAYKHLPVYNKMKKIWTLNKKVIDINTYTTPVSTISVSGE